MVLTRNPKGMHVQLIIYAITTLLMGLLLTWLLDNIFGWTSTGGSTIKIISWLILLIAWIVASAKLWFDWNAKHYELSNDALIIDARAGRLGTSRTVYRYESIISLRFSQGYWGKKFGYGDVRVTIPKIETEIVMNDIDMPEQQLAGLQRRIQAHTESGSTTALIS